MFGKNTAERIKGDEKLELVYLPLKKTYIPYYGLRKENSPDYRLRQRQGGRHLRHYGRTLQVRGDEHSQGIRQLEREQPLGRSPASVRNSADTAISLHEGEERDRPCDDH